ncbi:hypothetical protein POTOM_015752 [Populus tomentosa]|uniref:Prefoldin subunit 6 n=1 Tax=Populus tomentosa TaxID=118781 RepID=A0A8X8A3M2_POPTO|nr:hypothetical protein POTOM_015752 [Populus tomentosa]
MGSSTAIRELQRDLENKANDLSKHQKDIAKNHQVRKKYTIQLGENELVLKELDLLNEGANVYKLIGPVLVKQDLAEANANVSKRIEYISAELKRLDGTLQDLEEKQNSKKDAVCGFPFFSLIQFIIEVPCHMPLNMALAVHALFDICHWPAALVILILVCSDFLARALDFSWQLLSSYLQVTTEDPIIPGWQSQGIDMPS